MLKIEPMILEGNYVLLRPPSAADLFGLSQAARDGEIWNNPYAFFPHENNMPKYLQDLLKRSDSFLPFVIVDKQSDTIVGSTRYLNIDYDNHRMEIGHTWIAKSFRRTAVNTETKFLMLQFAFEKLKCIAIERRAIERLGAKEDGMRNGRIRDTVCYNLL
jgi:RimJ/RimL family protein N-acetyltransferase